MSEQQWPFGQHDAIRALRQTLLRPEYKVAWMRHAQRQPRGAINRLAVAHLLRERNVFNTGTTFSAIRAAVYRALSDDPDKQVLTPETLTRFTDGFEMKPEDAAHLHATLAGVDAHSARPEMGTLTPPSDGHSGPSPPPRQHATISLHELHTVGADGLPAHHRTVQVIRSLVDGLRSYPYRYDTDAAEVTVVRGGRVGEGTSDAQGQLHGVEIHLTRPLQQGETASIEYETTFHYRHPPPPEFRRAARGRVDNLELYVRFHRAWTPQHVWWARWGWEDCRPSSEILAQERIRLDPDLAVHRYLPYIKSTVVGFHWSR